MFDDTTKKGVTAAKICVKCFRSKIDVQSATLNFCQIMPNCSFSLYTSECIVTTARKIPNSSFKKLFIRHAFWHLTQFHSKIGSLNLNLKRFEKNVVFFMDSFRSGPRLKQFLRKFDKFGNFFIGQILQICQIGRNINKSLGRFGIFLWSKASDSIWKHRKHCQLQ